MRAEPKATVAAQGRPTSVLNSEKQLDQSACRSHLCSCPLYLRAAQAARILWPALRNVTAGSAKFILM